MKRRGNGEGSVHQLADGSWRAALVVAGRRRYMRGKTRAAVQRKLEAAKRGGVASSMRLDRFLVIWLDHIRPQVRPNTFAGYESIIRVHLASHALVQLRCVRPHTIMAILDAVSCAGRSENTVGHVRRVLAMALAVAAEWDLIHRNPCTSTQAPKKAPSIAKPMTAEELAAFLTAAEASDNAALLLVAAFTGARRGEVVGLKWADIDLERQTVSIRRTVQRVAGKLQEYPPKSKAGERTVRVPARCIAALRSHRAAQYELRMRNADVWEDRGYAFSGALGQPIQPEWLDDAYKAALRAAGVAPRRLHDLRHTAATLMILGGVNPKAVQGFMGHSSASITLDLYARLLPGFEAELVLDDHEIS
jgi:integrase